MVILQTNYGNIKLKLDFDNTPITAENFRKHVQSGYYDGTIFHRVINNFMIQGGGFETNMRQKQDKPAIQNEADKSLPNKRGTIAMARTSDPHSASVQFFINVVDNDFLNHKAKDNNGWGYCVFGEVVEGMDVVDKIKTVNTASRAGHQDVPTDEIIIEKATVEEDTD